MPHSSGGGHHGSGSHSDHSGSSGPTRAAFKHYREGRKRYVYYVNSSPTYFFSDYSPETFRKRDFIPDFIAFAIYFFVTIYSTILFILPTQKLSTNYDTEITINDEIDVLTGSEEQEIMKVFKDIQDKTGITMSLVTLDNSEWKNQHIDLETYAYRLYLNKFKDEKHWLITYSTDKEGDWYFEGMQGNDTDYILTESLTNSFNRQLYSALEFYNENNRGIGIAFVDSFKYVYENAMNKDVDYKTIWIVFVIFMVVGIISFKDKLHTFIHLKEIKSATKCPTTKKEPKTVECPYCGNIYVYGIHDSCPHCGAIIEDEN